MKNPPAGVKLVMAGVCVMKDIKPDKINDPAGTGGKARTLLENPTIAFLTKVYFMFTNPASNYCKILISALSNLGS